MERSEKTKKRLRLVYFFDKPQLLAVSWPTLSPTVRVHAVTWGTTLNPYVGHGRTFKPPAFGMDPNLVEVGPLGPGPKGPHPKLKTHAINSKLNTCSCFVLHLRIQTKNQANKPGRLLGNFSWGRATETSHRTPSCSRARPRG